MKYPLLSFNSGYLSPLVDARSDIDKYHAGCRIIENMIPRTYGCAERRPGTEFIDAAYDETKQIRLVPFEYSDEIAYMVEFGDYYCRFFYDGEVLMSDETNEYILTTPYPASVLRELHFLQSNDVMWIMHKDYPQHKLKRISATKFSLEKISYNNGPFLLRNDLKDANNPNNITMTPDVKSIAGKIGSYTLEAEDGYSFNAIYGRFWDPDASHAINGSQSDYCGGGNYDDYTQCSIKYTVTYDEPIASMSQIDINYICFSQIQSADLVNDVLHTKRGLRIYANGAWTTVIDKDTPNAEFPATANLGLPTSILGYDSTASITGSWTNVEKIEIYLFAYQNTDHRRAIVTALFNIAYNGEGVGYDSGTLTASSDYFDEDMVGGLFSLTQPRENSDSSGSRSSIGALTTQIFVEGDYSVSVAQGWRGTVKLQRKQGLNDWEDMRIWNSLDGYLAVQYTGTEEEANVYYRLYVSAWNLGTVSGSITVDASTQTGICRIVSYTSATVVEISVLKPFVTEDSTVRWAEGAWSDKRGYPRTGTFYGGRIYFAATPYEPQTIWASGVDQYENFEVCTKDDSPFQLTIASEKRNAIQWMSALESIILGAIGGEWRLRSNAYQEPITPTNFNIKQKGTIGSCSMQPERIGDALILVNYNRRKLYELLEQDETFKLRDLTLLAEDITLTGIYAMAFQKNPEPIIWMALGSGAVVSCSYNPEENVDAFAKHFTTNFTTTSTTTSTTTTGAPA
jgi:hypothetical protein